MTIMKQKPTIPEPSPRPLGWSLVVGVLMVAAVMVLDRLNYQTAALGTVQAYSDYGKHRQAAGACCSGFCLADTGTDGDCISGRILKVECTDRLNAGIRAAAALALDELFVPMRK
jgi:hypothetical protein